MPTVSKCDWPLWIVLWFPQVFSRSPDISLRYCRQQLTEIQSRQAHACVAFFAASHPSNGSILPETLPGIVHYVHYPCLYLTTEPIQFKIKMEASGTVRDSRALGSHFNKLREILKYSTA